MEKTPACAHSRRRFIGYAACLGVAGSVSKGAFADLPRDRIARLVATPVTVPGRLDLGPVQRNITMGGVVVEVTTDEGVTGIGFTSITNSAVVAAAVNSVASQALEDADAMSREAAAERLYQALTPRGQTGHAVHAISAIDIALWDILGKRLGQPVWRLLGGARASVPTYTTFGMAYLDRDELGAAARYLVDVGQRRLKMVVASNAYERVNGGQSLEEILREDAQRIRVVREAVGSEADIYIDANHALDAWHARRFIEDIAEYEVAFFEEPLRGNDVLRLADLRATSGMKIAAGQNEGHLRRFRDLIAGDAVDILQLNVCIGGGFTAGAKIAALAQAWSVPIDNGGGYALFNAHLHAGLANGGMAEWHMGAVALERELYRERFELDADRLALSEAPGVGLSIDPVTLRSFA
ncbi:MAG: mandelate racemase/muconate lactonizing enzyme family protein [Gammaproteobacteria bacterium]|jgi:L-alanine-DL-glutamate epimerase-like enolase superfamily enzyme